MKISEKPMSRDFVLGEKHFYSLGRGTRNYFQDFHSAHKSGVEEHYLKELHISFENFSYRCSYLPKGQVSFIMRNLMALEHLFGGVLLQLGVVS